MHIDRRLLGWGVFFILVGAIPLAVRGGFLDAEERVSSWPSLWPVLLIGWGLGLLLRRTPVEWIGGGVTADRARAHGRRRARDRLPRRPDRQRLRRRRPGHGVRHAARPARDRRPAQRRVQLRHDHDRRPPTARTGASRAATPAAAAPASRRRGPASRSRAPPTQFFQDSGRNTLDRGSAEGGTGWPRDDPQCRPGHGRPDGRERHLGLPHGERRARSGSISRTPRSSAT